MTSMKLRDWCPPLRCQLCNVLVGGYVDGMMSHDFECLKDCFGTSTKGLGLPRTNFLSVAQDFERHMYIHMQSYPSVLAPYSFGRDWAVSAKVLPIRATATGGVYWEFTPQCGG